MLARSERHRGTGEIQRYAVTLHIYDLAKGQTVHCLSTALRAVGAGAFHGGIQVHGIEHSFASYDGPGSGIFKCAPLGCTEHHYRESIEMGMTIKSPREVEMIIDQMGHEWSGRSYDLLGRNCCHFCDAFCSELGVDNLPFWVSLDISSVGADLRRRAKAAIAGSAEQWWDGDAMKDRMLSIGWNPAFALSSVSSAPHAIIRQEKPVDAADLRRLSMPKGPKVQDGKTSARRSVGGAGRMGRNAGA